VSKLLKFVLVTLLALSACQRRSRAYGGKSAENTQESDSQISVSAVPAHAHIEELLVMNKKIDGSALFMRHCASCHQATGNGIPGVFPPLNKSSYCTSDKTDRLTSIILYGLQGAVKVSGVTYTGVMPSFKDILKDEEIAAISSHIRNAWNNKAPAVGVDIVTASRKKWGDRGAFKIEELGAEE
jgi:cytochrome c